MGDRHATRRSSWDDLPLEVRTAVEQLADGRIVTFETSEGGFTVDAVVGVATLDNENRIFVKAVPHAHPAAADYRLERRVLETWPQPSPTARFVGSVAMSDWTVLVLDALDGSVAGEPWNPHHLDAALEAIGTVTRTASDINIDLPTVADRMGGRCETFRTSATKADLNDWCVTNFDRLQQAEATWHTVVVGDALVHFDLRHDNCWVRDDGSVVLLDWGRACLGPRWVDVVCLLLLSSIGSIDAEQLLRTHPLSATADETAVDAFLVALLSYWTSAAASPRPAGVPHLRNRQERSREATQQWLARRWRGRTGAT